MSSVDIVDVVLNKHCNSLQSEDKRARKRALESIKKETLENKDLNNDQLVSSFEQIQKHLIMCFHDRAEACREYVVSLVYDFLKTIPPSESYICGLMPEIVDRISGDVIQETSEEVRLALVILLRLIVSKYQPHLPPYLNDFVNIFVKMVVDPHPKVKKESCETVAELAKAIPKHFHMQSESLIQPLIQTLKHQQYRIRVAGINSIGDVVRYGNNKSVNDAVGPLAERLFDQNPAVRLAVARVVGMWLLELPDRYSFFYKIIPLMLTSLSDEIKEQREEAAQVWEKVGSQYMLENETDLKDKMDFLKEKLDHYPPNVRCPNLGCRTLVQRELSKYLSAIVNELKDWLDDVRVKSAQLLCITVQHVEHHITQHLEKILPAMRKSCSDSDKRVRDNIELAAQMIGYFVPPDVYCQIVLQNIGSDLGSLCVLANIVQTSTRDLLTPHLQEIMTALQLECTHHSREAGYQYQLLNVVSNLQQVCEHDCEAVGQDMFNVLVYVVGLAADMSISERAEGLLDGLSLCEDITSEGLYKKHTSSMLEALQPTAVNWTLHSPQRFAFEAVITHAGNALGLNLDIITEILRTVLKQEGEPELLLKMLMAVAHILQNSEVTLSLATDTKSFIFVLLTDVLKPQLIWRAGRAAEALRTAAVSCVVVGLPALPASSVTHELSGVLVPLLLALIEDSAFRTRQFAAQALYCIVEKLRENQQLNAEDINTIFPVVMKRLDDVNDTVRSSSVTCLRLLFTSPLPAGYDVSSYRGHLEMLYDTLLIHLDDPDENFRKVMLDTLKDISSACPSLLKERIKLDRFQNKNVCQELLQSLESLTVIN